MAALCRKLGVSRGGYYAWRDREASQRKMDDRRLLAEILPIFRASRETYGYPRVHAALKARNIVCGKHRVARIMRENSLKARMARRFKFHRHRPRSSRASRTCCSINPTPPPPTKSGWGT